MTGYYMNHFIFLIFLLPVITFAKWDVGHGGKSKIKNSKYIKECDGRYGIRTGNYCFLLSKKKKTWLKAVQECEKIDGQLAVIDKLVQFENFKNQRNLEKFKVNKKGKQKLKKENIPLLELAKTDIWIGLSDRTAKGVYKWIDGSLLDSNNDTLIKNMWDVGVNSEESDREENCVTLTRTGNLKDISCNKKLVYLCQFTIGMDEKVIKELNRRSSKVNHRIELMKKRKRFLANVERINERSVEEGKVFQMDIKLTEGQKLAIKQNMDPSSRRAVQKAIDNERRKRGLASKVTYDNKRSVIEGVNYRWPGATIPYTFSPDVAQWDRDTIVGGLKVFHDKTCVKFVERTDQRNYLYIKNDVYECTSFVGMVGGYDANDPGKQNVNLHPDCLWYIGTVQHELMHALGFWHEHVRPDRDDYIDIKWTNIKEYAKGNFDKMVNSLTYNYEYDYGSVMHYNPYSFAIDREVMTIIPKNAYEGNMGQREAPSDQDIVEINHLYGCSKDGSWGSWSAWSTCTKTCGGGTQQRNRGCNNPEPGPNGQTCPGDAKENQGCMNEKCPSDAKWAGCWSDVFIEIIGYTQVEDINPILDGDYKTRQSKIDKCVSVAKATGNKYAILRFNGYCYVDNDDMYTINEASRDCDSGGAGTDTAIDVYQLGDSSVPLDGHWTVWTDATCSKTCGTGTRLRSRECLNPAPANGGADCSGYATYTLECNTQACP